MAIASVPGARRRRIQNAPKAPFQSAPITGNGSAQSTAHSLGVVPSRVVVSLIETTADANVLTPGAHDSTNCIVTATTGAKYVITAWE